jgi:hypothetical protein
VPLADGSIGIGGLSARLLYRCAQLLAPDGRLLIEAEPGNIDERMTAWLEHPDGRRGPVFPWARKGTAALRAQGTPACTSWGNGSTRTARSSARHVRGPSTWGKWATPRRVSPVRSG